jgi:RHS repeat-associated protein
VAKTVSGVRTEYVLDGNQVVAEYDGSGSWTRFWIFAGLDEPIRMMAANAGQQFYHQDAQGSVVALSWSNGGLAERYAYGPYGELSSASGLSNPFTYTGRSYDSETGLYYYRARHYDASLGRFLQPDPMGYGDGLNVYAYVGGNPVNLVDPLGLSAERGFSGGLSQGGGFTVAGGDGVFIPMFIPGASQESLDALRQGESLGTLAGGALVAGGIAAPSLATAGLIRLAPLVPSAGILANRLLSLQKPIVKNPALVRAVDKLFQSGDQFAGGTAGAIRVTQFTGRLVGNSNHIQAGIDRARQLQNIMNRGGLSASDRAAATALRSDLISALRFAGEAP